MLAPIDKLQAGRNQIIQIVITTACDRECSNCTQLLAWRTDYKFMTLECAREAFESLKDWPGIVALFGGNPCVHPQFPEICRIMSEIIKPEQRGLWSNNLFKHGHVAKETFGRARMNNLNAHGDPEAFRNMSQWFGNRVIPESGTKQSMHAPILIDPKDFGVTAEEWVRLREGCDINQDWSGAIVQRSGKPYAYFCEVAAALDGIRGENSGVPAIPGWWRQRMPTFEHQVKNCCDRGCGYPLRAKGAFDTDEVQHLSRSWIRQLPERKVNIQEVAAVGERASKATDYMRRVTT